LRQQLNDTRDPRAVVDRAFRPSSIARKARSPDFIRRVSDIFEHDPSRSIRDVAKELDVSHVTLLACVTEDLPVDAEEQEHAAPSSPDLNLMDYFFWGYLERHTNRLAHSTKAALMNSIMKQARELYMALVAKACSSFRARIQRVIDAEGGWIE
ncbi:Uncharacterized protein FKW44_000948, partial [Caligus rogercresseyi]